MQHQVLCDVRTEKIKKVMRLRMITFEHKFPVYE